jgi:hypothetical protein
MIWYFQQVWLSNDHFSTLQYHPSNELLSTFSHNFWLKINCRDFQVKKSGWESKLCLMLVSRNQVGIGMGIKLCLIFSCTFWLKKFKSFELIYNLKNHSKNWKTDWHWFLEIRILALKNLKSWFSKSIKPTWNKIVNKSRNYILGIDSFPIFCEILPNFFSEIPISLKGWIISSELSLNKFEWNYCWSKFSGVTIYWQCSTSYLTGDNICNFFHVGERIRTKIR